MLGNVKYMYMHGYAYITETHKYSATCACVWMYLHWLCETHINTHTPVLPRLVCVTSIVVNYGDTAGLLIFKLARVCICTRPFMLDKGIDTVSLYTIRRNRSHTSLICISLLCVKRGWFTFYDWCNKDLT